MDEFFAWQNTFDLYSFNILLNRCRKILTMNFLMELMMQLFELFLLLLTSLDLRKSERKKITLHCNIVRVTKYEHDELYSRY